MNNIFNYLNDIICHKEGDLLGNVDDESGYNSYMINRWLSMYSPNNAVIINYTVNQYYSIFETKQDHYKFLVNIIPKTKIYRIKYIKKGNKEKTDDHILDRLAKRLEISKREIRYYIDSHNIDISKYKKLWEA